MESRRHNTPFLPSTSNRRRGLREVGVAPAEANASVPDPVRDMEPFFSNEEKIDYTLVNGHRSSTRKSQSGGKPRRGHDISTKCSREVGVSTLPIGQFQSSSKEAQPLTVESLPMNNVEVKSELNKEVVNGCTNVSKAKHDNKCNGGNTDRRSAHNRAQHTSMVPFFNVDNEDLGGCTVKSVVQSLTNANERSPYRPDTPASSLTENLGRVSITADKGPLPTQHVDALSDAKPSYPKSNHLKSILKEMGIIPSISTEEAPQRPYAFSKYSNSPDPSSIPIPGLR